jgi:deoxyribodipyrimidine photolyase
VESEILLDEIREKYDIAPGKRRFGEGGTREARRRLQDFLERIESYSGCISSPPKAEALTSHLSPNIRYGCISPRLNTTRCGERLPSVLGIPETNFGEGWESTERFEGIRAVT